MLDIFYTTRFKKDFKLMEKRGKNMSKLEKVIGKLMHERIQKLYEKISYSN